MWFAIFGVIKPRISSQYTDSIKNGALFVVPYAMRMRRTTPGTKSNMVVYIRPHSGAESL